MTTGPFATFSSSFLVATFNLTGLLNASGQYSIALWIETDAGTEIEVASRSGRGSSCWDRHDRRG